MLALLLTFGVAIALVSLMVYLYAKPVAQADTNDSSTKLRDFFSNILSSGQGLFSK
jgi:hypothetical protein